MDTRPHLNKNTHPDEDDHVPEQIVFDLTRQHHEIHDQPSTKTITYVTSRNPNVQELIQEALTAPHPDDIEIALNFLKRQRQSATGAKFNPFTTAPPLTSMTAHELFEDLPRQTDMFTKQVQEPTFTSPKPHSKYAAVTPTAKYFY